MGKGFFFADRATVIECNLASLNLHIMLCGGLKVTSLEDWYIR